MTARPQRVLLVDDSPDVREMCRLWLTCWGFRVDEASSGAEAVEKARAQSPDLIVIALAMPGLDGRAAMRLLAMEPATAAVPIVTLSPQAPVSSPPNCADAECSLMKPAEPDQLLLDYIRSALRPRSRTPAAVIDGRERWR